MIHYSVGASRKVARIVAALSAPLLAIIGAGLANAGGAGPDSQSALRGSYCEGSDQDLGAPMRAGCTRISGYITAGARSGSDDRIGGRRDPFGPIDEPAITGNPSSRLTIVGAPLSADRFLSPTSEGDIAR
jgi:hypothetical protein